MSVGVSFYVKLQVPLPTALKENFWTALFLRKTYFGIIFLIAFPTLQNSMIFLRVIT